MLSRVLSGDCDRRRVSDPADVGVALQRLRTFRGQYRRVSDVIVCSLSRTVTFVAFWVAVAAPFLSLLLLVGGLQSSGERTAFVTLVALNLVALGLGHQYHPAGTRGRKR